MYWRVVSSFLVALCSRTFNEHCLIFLQTKTSAHRLRIILGLLGLNVEELHGNLTQLQVRDSTALHVFNFDTTTVQWRDTFLTLLCTWTKVLVSDTFPLTLSLSCISHEQRSCKGNGARLHSAHSIFLDLWVFFHRVHAVSYTWLVTKIFFQFTYVDSSSMSRASVLPDKRAACVVNKKDFVCAKRRICRPRKPLVPVFVLMRLKIGLVKT